MPTTRCLLLTASELAAGEAAGYYTYRSGPHTDEGECLATCEDTGTGTGLSDPDTGTGTDVVEVYYWYCIAPPDNTGTGTIGEGFQCLLLTESVLQILTGGGWIVGGGSYDTVDECEAYCATISTGTGTGTDATGTGTGTDTTGTGTGTGTISTAETLNAFFKLQASGVVFTNDGLDILAKVTTGAEAIGGLALYANDYTPVAGSTLGDFQEATFPGYMQQGAPSFSAPSVAGNVATMAIDPASTFGNDDNDQYYGWYLLNLTGTKVICACRAPGTANPVSLALPSWTLEADTGADVIADAALTYLLSLMGGLNDNAYSIAPFVNDATPTTGWNSGSITQATVLTPDNTAQDTMAPALVSDHVEAEMSGAFTHNGDVVAETVYGSICFWTTGGQMLVGRRFTASYLMDDDTDTLDISVLFKLSR